MDVSRRYIDGNRQLILRITQDMDFITPYVFGMPFGIGLHAPSSIRIGNLAVLPLFTPVAMTFDISAVDSNGSQIVALSDGA